MPNDLSLLNSNNVLIASKPNLDTFEQELPKILTERSDSNAPAPEKKDPLAMVNDLMSKVNKDTDRLLNMTQQVNVSNVYKDTGLFGIKTAYADIGYNPTYNMEDKLSKRGAYDKITDTLAATGMVAIGTFLNNQNTKMNIVKSLTDGDFKRIWDNEFSQEISDTNANLMDVYRTGTNADVEREDGLWGTAKQFMGLDGLETMGNAFGTLTQNLGFTVGTVADIALENAAIGLVTGAETGGAGAVVAGARGVAQSGRALYRGLAMTIKALSGADDIINAGKMAYKTLGITKNIFDGAKTAFKTAATLGVRGFYTAAGEASLESASHAKEYRDEQIKKQEELTGRSAKEDVEFMKTLDAQTAKLKTDVFKGNIPILMASNILMFGNKMLKATNAFGMAEKGAMAELLTIGEKGVARTKKAVAMESLAGKAGYYGGKIGKGFLGATPEALEEVLQGVVGAYAKRRYDLFDNDSTGLIKKLGADNIEESNTGEMLSGSFDELKNRAGTNEFWDEAVSGLMTGLLMGAGGKALRKAKGETKQRTATLNSITDEYNKLRTDGGINQSVIDDYTTTREQGGQKFGKTYRDINTTQQIHNLVGQANAMGGQSLAVEQNNKKDFNDHKHQSLVDFLALNAKLGRSEYGIQVFKETLDGLEDNELAERLGTTVEDVSKNKETLKKDIISKLEASQKEFDETYNAIGKKYKNQYNIKTNPHQYRAWEDAKIHLSAYQQDWGDALVRTKQLSKEINAHLKNNYGVSVDESDINVINDDVLLTERIAILEDTIKTIEEGNALNGVSMSKQEALSMSKQEALSLQDQKNKLLLLKRLDKDKNTNGKYQETANEYISYLANKNNSGKDLATELSDLWKEKQDITNRLNDAKTETEKAIVKKELDAVNSKIESKKLINFVDQDMHQMIRDMSDLEYEQRFSQDMFNVLRGNQDVFKSYVDKLYKAEKEEKSRRDAENKGSENPMNRPAQKTNNEANSINLETEIASIVNNISEGLGATESDIKSLSSKLQKFIEGKYKNINGVLVLNTDNNVVFNTLKDLIINEKENIIDIIKKETNKDDASIEKLINDELLRLEEETALKLLEIENSLNETITDEEFNDFVDNNNVSDKILDLIINKLINGQQLTTREFQIASSNTDLINKKIETYFNEENNDTTTSNQSEIEDIIGLDITYKGEKGKLYIDGQSLIFEVKGTNREYEIGNKDELKDIPIKDLDIEIEESVVSIDDNENILIRGKQYINNYSDPLAAINYDKDGGVISVNLETEKGEKRTFRGNIAEDFAYQIHLKKITKDNETREQFEQFINEDESTRNEIDDARLSEITKEEAIRDNEEISRDAELKALEQSLKEITKAETTSNISNQSEIEAKKADIEKSRQEELKNQIWNNSGTKFKNDSFVAKDGNTYDISASEMASGHRMIRVKDINKKTLADIFFKENGDGTFYITDVKSVVMNGIDFSSTMYDYFDNNVGTIKITDTTTAEIGNSWDSNKNRINAKYDAKLKALEQKQSTSNVVEEGSGGVSGDLSKMNQSEFAQWIQDNKDYLHSIERESTSMAGKKIIVKPFENQYYDLLTVRPEHREQFIKNKGVLSEVDFNEAREYYKTLQKEEAKYSNSDSNPDWIQFNFGNTTNTEVDGNRRKGYITISENSIDNFKGNISNLIAELNKALEGNYNGSFKIAQKLGTLKNQFDNLVIHGANDQEVQNALNIINKTLLENGVDNKISQIGIDGKNKKGDKTSHTRLLEEKIQNNELVKALEQQPSTEPNISETLSIPEKDRPDTEPTQGIETGITGTLAFGSKTIIPSYKEMIVEADSVEASHLYNTQRNPKFIFPTLQPKSKYTDVRMKKVDADMIGKWREDAFKDSNNPFKGSPIVRKGQVIQGNNRTIGINEDYNRENGNYKDKLIEYLENSGAEPELIESVRSMNKPMLVRAIDETSIEEARVLGNIEEKEETSGGAQIINDLDTFISALVVNREGKVTREELLNEIFSSLKHIITNVAGKELDNSDKTRSKIIDFLNSTSFSYINNKLNDSELNNLIEEIIAEKLNKSLTVTKLNNDVFLAIKEEKSELEKIQGSLFSIAINRVQNNSTKSTALLVSEFLKQKIGYNINILSSKDINEEAKKLGYDSFNAMVDVWIGENNYKVIDELDNYSTITLEFKNGRAIIGEAYGLDESMEQFDERFSNSEFYIEIQDLRVNEDSQGLGIGGALLRDSINYIYQKYGNVDIYLNASPIYNKKMNAQELSSFYAKYGFSELKNEGTNVEMLKKGGSDIKFLKDKNETIYGFYNPSNNQIYLTEEVLSSENLVHELYHAFKPALREKASQGDATAQSILDKMEGIAIQYIGGEEKIDERYNSGVKDKFNEFDLNKLNLEEGFTREETENIQNSFKDLKNKIDEEKLIEKNTQLQSEVYNPRVGETKEQYRSRLIEEAEAILLQENSIEYFENIAKEMGLDEKQTKSFIDNIKDFIKSFSEWIVDKLGITNITPEQVSEMTQKELFDRITTSMIRGDYFGAERELDANESPSSTNDIRFQIVGEKGIAELENKEEAKIRLANLQVAREMELANKTSLEIRQATGWERGGDMKWRYEIEDGIVDFNKPSNQVNLNYYDYPLTEYNLKDIYKNDILYKTYPLLLKTKVYIYSQKEEFLSKIPLFYLNNTIYINEKFYNEQKEGNSLSDFFRGRIAHEIQHHIQTEEGFSKGGNSTIIKSILRSFINFANIEGNERKEFGEDGTIERYIQESLISISGTNNNIDIVNRINNSNLIDTFATYIYNALGGEVESRNVEKRLNFNPNERLNNLLKDTEDVSRKDQIFIENSINNSSYTASENNVEENNTRKEEIIKDLRDIREKSISSNKVDYKGYDKQVIDDYLRGASEILNKTKSKELEILEKIYENAENEGVLDKLLQLLNIKRELVSKHVRSTSKPIQQLEQIIENKNNQLIGKKGDEKLSIEKELEFLNDQKDILQSGSNLDLLASIIDIPINTNIAHVIDKVTAFSLIGDGGNTSLFNRYIKAENVALGNSNQGIVFSMATDLNTINGALSHTQLEQLLRDKNIFYYKDKVRGRIVLHWLDNDLSVAKLNPKKVIEDILNVKIEINANGYNYIVKSDGTLLDSDYSIKSKFNLEAIKNLTTDDKVSYVFDPTQEFNVELYNGLLSGAIDEDYFIRNALIFIKTQEGDIVGMFRAADVKDKNLITVREKTIKINGKISNTIKSYLNDDGTSKEFEIKGFHYTERKSDTIIQVSELGATKDNFIVKRDNNKNSDIYSIKYLNKDKNEIHIHSIREGNEFYDSEIDRLDAIAVELSSIDNIVSDRANELIKEANLIAIRMGSSFSSAPSSRDIIVNEITNVVSNSSKYTMRMTEKDLENNIFFGEIKTDINDPYMSKRLILSFEDDSEQNNVDENSNKEQVPIIGENLIRNESFTEEDSIRELVELENSTDTYLENPSNMEAKVDMLLGVSDYLEKFDVNISQQVYELQRASTSKTKEFIGIVKSFWTKGINLQELLILLNDFFKSINIPLIKSGNILKYIEKGNVDKDLIYVNIENPDFIKLLAFSKNLTGNGIIYTPNLIEDTMLEGIFETDAKNGYDFLVEQGDSKDLETLKKYGISEELVGAYYVSNNEVKSFINSLENMSLKTPSPSVSAVVHSFSYKDLKGKSVIGSFKTISEIYCK